MVHRRPDYYVSVRMCSDEVANAETCNGEGLRIHNTADGTTIVKHYGDEYTGIFPVWDWRRVPGTTAEIVDTPLAGDPRYKGTAGFVGGVSDGTSERRRSIWSTALFPPRKPGFVSIERSCALGLISSPAQVALCSRR